MMRQIIPNASYMANYHHQQPIANYSEEALIIRQSIYAHMDGKVCLRGREQGEDDSTFESTT